MTRLYFILSIMLALCFSQNSEAANFYWGGRALASHFELEGLKLKLKGALGYLPQSVDLRKDSSSIAPGAAIFTGLDFNRAGSVPLRLEYEASLQNIDESLRVNNSFQTPAGPVNVVAVKAKLDISTMFSHSLNLWLDIPVGSFPLKPYVGCALGMTYIFYDAEAVTNRGSGIESSADKSGHKRAYYYSIGGGARMALNKRMFIDLSLRYLEKQDIAINMYPLGLDFSTRNMNTAISLQYYF